MLSTARVSAERRSPCTSPYSRDVQSLDEEKRFFEAEAMPLVAQRPVRMFIDRRIKESLFDDARWTSPVPGRLLRAL